MSSSLELRIYELSQITNALANLAKTNIRTDNIIVSGIRVDLHGGGRAPGRSA